MAKTRRGFRSTRAYDSPGAIKGNAFGGAMFQRRAKENPAAGRAFRVRGLVPQRKSPDSSRWRKLMIGELHCDCGLMASLHSASRGVH